MKKSSFLAGVTLLFASLFTTSCKEIMSNLDEPVSSYLTVNDADVVVPTGDTYQIEAASINSDKVITYKSSDEKVATVDENGLVTGIADGEATITVAVEASENYNAGEQKIQVAVKRPLTFEAQADGSVYVDFSNGVTLEKPIYYSVDGSEKVPFTAWVEIPLKKGQKVEFESANDHVCAGAWSRGLRFWPGMKCAVYGNVMSLISPDGNYHVNKEITVPGALFGLFSGDSGWDYDGSNWNYNEYPNSNILSHDTYKLELPATTLASSCYGQMFKLCSGLKKAPILPATELADYCYQHMFEKCYNLTKAPKLSATTMKEGCYGYMFESCSALEEAPVLPATTLAPWCYQNMFTSCSKLENAPALPATKLAERCYENMFSNTALKEIPALPATKLEPYCYLGMFQGCQSLNKTPILPATELADYCYQNMFQSTSLKVVPALPVTNLAVGCYSYMFAYSYGLGGSIVLPAEELPAECYQEMFSWCRKLEKVECLATSMTGNNALTNWLNGAGTELETNPVFVRAEANNKWKNKDGWAVSQTSNDWYIPTNWTIEPPIAVEKIRVKTYTDGAFPYWSTNNCVTSVINGAAHYVPTGSWNQFVCLPGSENPLAAGDYVFILDINSDKDLDANMVDLNIRKGWGSDGNPVTAKVPIKAGRHSYRLELPGVIGGNYDCYFTPGNADATLDLYSVSVNKVVE